MVVPHIKDQPWPQSLAVYNPPWCKERWQFLILQPYSTKTNNNTGLLASAELLSCTCDRDFLFILKRDIYNGEYVGGEEEEEEYK